MKFSFLFYVLAIVFSVHNKQVLSQNYIDLDLNVALHGNTSQSSTYRNYGSDKAVDGDTDGDVDNGHCTHTGNGDENPWFQVTFPQSKIKYIQIYNRDSKVHRLMGFKLELYIGDTLVNTYVDKEVLPQDIYTINYSPRLTATKALITQLNIHGEDSIPFITICEIEIFGDIIVCEDGFYGDECLDPCSSHCSTTTCAIRTGSCTCKTGYTGIKCDQSCNPGTYGINCRKKCSINCLNTCSYIDGSCSPCKSGYQGSKCDQECDATKYGEDCKFTCSSSCIHNDCNKVTGRCLNCPDGKFRDYCKEEKTLSPSSYIGTGVGITLVVAGVMAVIIFSVLFLRRRHLATIKQKETKAYNYNRPNESTNEIPNNKQHELSDITGDNQ